MKLHLLQDDETVSILIECESEAEANAHFDKLAKQIKAGKIEFTIAGDIERGAVH